MSQRFHQMDFCRAVFMYCGLFFHAGLIYGAGYEWRVTSDQTSSILALFSNFIHHFRMEAFYLLSGFFYLLAFEKGRSGFLQDKFLRAFIPMIVIGFTLNTVMNQMSYNFQFVWDWSYIVQGKWLSHLWFLGNLVMYFLIAWPVCRLLQSNSSIVLQDKTNQLARTAPPLWLYLILLLAFSVSAQFLTNNTQLKTLLFINLYYFAYYLGYFLMGVIAFKARDDFFKLVHIRWFPLYLVTYAVLQLTGKVDMGLSQAAIYLCKLLSHFPLMLAAFSLLCFVGNKENPLIRSLSESSYTVYLLHQPLLIIFYVVLFKDVRLGVFTEYLLLTTAIFIVPSLLHSYVIKKSPLLMLLLNGVSKRKGNGYKSRQTAGVNNMRGNGAMQ